MTVYLHRVGAETEPARFTWEPRDCSLYALAVGAGVHDVAFTTEGDAGVAQRVYPTFAFAAVAALSAGWPDPCLGTGDFPLERVVLGEQGLALHRPLTPAGDVTVRARVAGIHDTGSAAVVVIEQHAADSASGEPWFTSTVHLFVRGEGGFGGQPAPDTGRRRMPERPCDDAVEVTTLPVQTLLYRHAGNDANPVHVDPAFAARAGFEGPILTGQNTLGIACRAVVERLAGGDPAPVRSVGGRFVAPAYNGETLRTELWVEPVGEPGATTVVRFRVLAGGERVVLDRGMAELG